MNALSQPKTEKYPPRQQRRQSARRSRPLERSRSPFAGHFAEASMILGVNLALIGVCVYTLSQLLPHQLTQQAKLRELEGEVQRKTQTVEALKQSYEKSLNPELSRRIAEEQSHLIPQTKRNLVWVKKDAGQTQ